MMNLKNLSEYCDKWQLTVNANKTKTMIFQNKNTNIPNSFEQYKDIAIQNVKEYKYLGSLISSNGSLINSTLDMTKKARKVLFAAKSYTSDFIQIPVKVSCSVFDSLIQPILTYNAEISFMDHYLKYYRAKLRAQKNGSEIDNCTFIDRTPFEKLHLSFCKNTLGTKKCSSNLATRAELGRLPVEAFIKTQAILYCATLFSNNINPLLKEAFQLTERLDNEGTYSWYTFSKNIIEETGITIDQLQNLDYGKQINNFKHTVKNHTHEYYKNINAAKIENLTVDNKIYLYKSIKLNKNQIENY